jgi:hypothetical protein
MDSNQMATFVASALQLLKTRRDLLPEDTARDDYYEMRVKEAIAELKRKGIRLTDAVDDLMLVVDLAAWNHANRDKQGAQPDWLRHKLRGRWINNDT